MKIRCSIFKIHYSIFIFLKPQFAVSATGASCLGEPSGPTAIMLSKITLAPGLMLLSDAVMASLSVLPDPVCTDAVSLGLAIMRLKRVILNLASKSKLSNMAKIALWALRATVGTFPLDFHEKRATGSGIRLALNKVLLNTWVFPGEISADTETVTVPGLFTLATYFPSDPLSLPAGISIRMFLD